MKAPNWKTCTEEELWKYVGYHLASHGIENVLVGGAVVAIYSKGAYQSGDLDFIVKSSDINKLDSILQTIGFVKTRGRHYEHPECDHLIIEFPPGPISIGDDYKIQPEEKKVYGKSIKILSPTDCIRDRLASFIHFKVRDCLDQAVLVAESVPHDLKKIKDWCHSEGANDAYVEFVNKIQKKNL